MKTGVAAACAAALWVMMLFPAAAAAEEVDDLAEGFMGIRWGADPASAEGLSRLYSKDGVDYYIRPGEIHTINAVQVPKVVYGFHQGRFFAAYMEVETPEVFGEIRSTLKRRYGDSETVFSTKDNRIVHKWKRGEVKIKLKAYDEGDRMKLAFYYTPISTRVNEENLESYHDKALELFPIRKGETPKALPLLRF